MQWIPHTNKWLNEKNESSVGKQKKQETRKGRKVTFVEGQEYKLPEFQLVNSSVYIWGEGYENIPDFQATGN